MEKIRKYGLFMAIIVFTASLSILTISQTTFATLVNPVELPKGIWAINAGGQKGQLDITSVMPDGQLIGTMTFFESGTTIPAYYSKIFGFWDADAWKITFLKENKVFWINHALELKHPLSCNTVDPRTGEACHHRDVIFTGYMFGGLPCASPKDPGCLSTGGKPLYMAGTSQNFGGSTGTGAIAERSVFGWFASYTNPNLTQLKPMYIQSEEKGESIAK
jgi:hypothetical protein